MLAGALFLAPDSKDLNMCRFTMYLGPPIRLTALLVEPAHSLILQSFRASERAEPLNGDGFGLGWYAPQLSDEPALFRSISPAWNNENLKSLAGVVASPCILAHVRAASVGMPVTELNCHPFQHDRYLFMHNGHVGSFAGIRRSLLAGLCDEAFALVRGNTDSEHVFAVFIDELVSVNLEDDDALARALNRAVWRTVELVRELGGAHPSYLNLAVSDGRRIAACRFADTEGTRPESLYVVQRELYEPVSSGTPARRKHERFNSTVIASERLTDEDDWHVVEPNQMVSVHYDGRMSLFAMEPEELVPV